MTAPSGGAANSSGRQRRIGGLLGRLNGTHQRYEWLVRAFPHAPAPLLFEAAGQARRKRYRRGDVIVAEGAPADRFYVVISGEAEVIQRIGNRDVYVSTFAPGQYFGEVGLLASRLRMTAFPRCGALLRNGQPCGRTVARDSEVCSHHKNLLATIDAERMRKGRIPKRGARKGSALTVVAEPASEVAAMTATRMPPVGIYVWPSACAPTRQ